MFVDVISWALVIVSICGTVLNARKKKLSWLVWLFASFGLFWINFLVYRFYAQAMLCLVYCILDLYGYTTWGDKNKQDGEVI